MLVLAIEIDQLLPKLFLPKIMILLFLILGTMHTNFDPVTKYLFPGADKEYSVDFYNIAFELRGPDRILYNLLYLEATKHQNNLLRKVYATDADVTITNCLEMKLGEKMWSISVHNEFYPLMTRVYEVRCLNVWDFERYPELLEGKKIYLPPETAAETLVKLQQSDIKDYQIIYGN